MPKGDIIPFSGYSFWYEAMLVKVNKRTGALANYKAKQGSVRALTALMALDKLHEEAEKSWNAEIKSLKIYDDQSNLVASTEWGESQKPLEVAKKKTPLQSAMDATRERKRQAKAEEKKHKPAPTYSSRSWPAQYGTRRTKTYSTLRLK